jgi:hypothetical protein
MTQCARKIGDLRSAAMILRLLQLGLAVMPALCVTAVLPQCSVYCLVAEGSPHFSLTRVHRRKVATNAGFHALMLIPEAFLSQTAVFYM